MKRQSLLISLLCTLIVFPAAAQQPVAPPNDENPLNALGQTDSAADADYLFLSLPPVTDEQIDSAQVCIDLMAQPQPPRRSSLTPDCALAFDALELADQPITDATLDTVAALVRHNSSLLLTDPLMAYYDRVPLVAPMRFSDSPLESVDISYQFTGNDWFMAYELLFSDVDGHPRLTGYEVSQPESDPVPTPDIAYQSTPSRFEAMSFDAEMVRALPDAFTNLIPVRSVYGGGRCEEYNPFWRVTLTYADGTEVRLLSLGGDQFDIDGPWLVTSGSGRYFQYSHAIGQAMVELMASLDAPLGSREGTVCEEAVEFERGYFAQSYIFMG